MRRRQAGLIMSAVLAASLLGACAPAAPCDLVIVGTDDPGLLAIPSGALPVVVGSDVDPSGWQVIPDDGSGAGDQVAFRLKPEAAARFAAFTGTNVGRYIAIAVNDRVVAVPMIQAAIEDGEVAISLRDQTDIDAFAPCLASAASG